MSELSVQTDRRMVRVQKKGLDPMHIVGFLVLIVVTFIMLAPLWFMISTSFKTSKEMLLFPPTFIPHTFAFENYADIFKNSDLKFGLQYVNSIKVGVLTVIGTVLSSSFVAFGFSRYAVKGKNLLFLLMLSTLMLPYPAIMIPQFLLFTKLGLHDSIAPLVLPAFFGTPYMIFLLRQFFITLPNELFDAGKIDGCSEFRLYWNVALTLSGPVLATVSIFTFIWSWTDLLTPVLYLDSQENFTLPIGMASMLSSKFRIAPWNLLMVASILSVLPIIALFAVAQKRFVEGIVFSGIK